MESNIKQRVEALTIEGYNFRLGDYVGEGFSLLQKYMGGFVGYTLLYAIISVVISGIQEEIPIIGGIVSLLVSGPLMAGYVIVANKIQMGETPAFENFFDGFKYFKELAILSLISGAIYIAAFVPFGLISGYFIYFGQGVENLFLENFAAQSGGFIFTLFLACAAIVYISVSFAYSTFFVIFHKVTAIEALGLSYRVISKKWFTFLLFFFVIGIIAILGVVGLVIGVLFTIPAMICAHYLSFHDIVGVGSLREENLEDHLVEM